MRVLLICILNLFNILMMQAITINVDIPGSLPVLLSSVEKTSVTSLILTGNIDARDVKYIRDELTNLAVLDMSAVAIKAYNGSDGTTPYIFLYPSDKIPDNSFNNKKSLRQIYLPVNVSSIGDYAFFRCSGLSDSLVIPNSVTSIGDYSFSDCFGLSGHLVIPESITSIGTGAFSHCSNLTGSLVIPETVTSLKNGAFGYCSGFTSIVIPNSIVSISDFTFRGCSGISRVVIPNYVKAIGNYAFAACSGLENLTLLDSVFSIGCSAFESCGKLKSLIIPKSVKTLGQNAFWGCKGLTSISVYSKEPIDLSSSIDVFYDVDKKGCTLLVSAGLRSLFEKASQWNTFENVVERDTLYNRSIGQSNDSGYPRALQDSTLKGLLESIKISKWKGGAKTCANFSFDDNYTSHNEIARILDQYNYKGTFFVISMNMLVDSLIAIFSRGHEIGSHTVMHYDLNNANAEEDTFQLSKSKEMIENAIGAECVSFAEPHHIKSSLGTKIAFGYYLFIRNHSEYQSHQVLPMNSELTIKGFMKYVDAGIQNGEMLLFSGHGIDGNGFSPMKKDFFIQTLNYVKSYVDSGVIWVATIKEGEQYENLYHEVSFNKEQYGDTIRFNFRNYNKEKYKDLATSPISLEIPFRMCKGIVSLTDFVEIIKTVDRYVVTTDLKRSTGLVLVLDGLSKYTDSMTLKSEELLIIHPNPVRDILTLSYLGSLQLVEIYDLEGRLMFRSNNDIFQIKVSHLPKGLYVIKVQTIRNGNVFRYRNNFLKL